MVSTNQEKRIVYIVQLERKYRKTMAMFELSIIVLAIVFLLLLKKIDANILKKFAIIFIGILLFQYFTQALWLTVGLAPWAYLYLGVSWVITLGRALMVIVSITLIDLYFPQYEEKMRFWFYFIPIVLLGLIAEAISSANGTIQYHSALQEVLSGIKILGMVPVEALFYIPTFMIFVLCFYKYWGKILNTKQTMRKRRK